jgi:signal transduction histidine kinase
VCAKVLEDHGGRISLRSEPGDTTFTVDWPLDNSSPTAR